MSKNITVHLSDALGQTVNSAILALGGKPDAVGAAFAKDKLANETLAQGSLRTRLAEVEAGGMAEAIIGGAHESLRRLYEHCESPIERAIAPWLLFGWYGPRFQDRPARVHVPKEDDAFPPGEGVIIVPQMAFVRFRVDFAVVANLDNRKSIVAVECDGRDYHADPEADWMRDNFLRSWGIRTVRATGEEIYTNPGKVFAAVVSAVVEATDFGDGSALA